MFFLKIKVVGLLTMLFIAFDMNPKSWMIQATDCIKMYQYLTNGSIAYHYTFDCLHFEYLPFSFVLYIQYLLNALIEKILQKDNTYNFVLAANKLMLRRAWLTLSIGCAIIYHSSFPVTTKRTLMLKVRLNL